MSDSENQNEDSPEIDPSLDGPVSDLGRCKIGEVQVFNQIVVYPLLGKSSGPDYLTLNAALDQSALTVTEVSEGGSVPELKVTTHATLPILIIDGEELVGAKQNRVVNTSILLGEKDELIIPVSCTEQGRWHYTSAAFQKSANVLERKTRARKSRAVHCSLEEDSGHQSNQGDVWEGIGELSAKASFHSPTSAMKDVFEVRENDLRRAMERFTMRENQVGLIVEIDGKIVGLDWVSRPHAYAELHDKLVRSYILDPLLDPPKPEAKPSKPKAKRFLTTALKTQGKRFPSPGRGDDLRFKTPQLAGSVLALDGHAIHAAFFRLEPETAGGNQMASLRRRRMRHADPEL